MGRSKCLFLPLSAGLTSVSKLNAEIRKNGSAAPSWGRLVLNVAFVVESLAAPLREKRALVRKELLSMQSSG